MLLYLTGGAEGVREVKKVKKQKIRFLSYEC